MEKKFYHVIRDHIKAREIIHIGLIEEHPIAVNKAKKLFQNDYVKFILLIIIIIFSYFLFSNSKLIELFSQLNDLNYFGIFISGILIVFGFSAPLAVGFLIVSQPTNIFLAAFIGGIGATLGDLLIFKTIKYSFMNEFNRIKNSNTFRKIKRITEKNISIKIRHYLLYLFAGIFISTPLPDEVGVSMLAGLTTIKERVLAVIAFILHTIAIFLILAASS